jgi:thymidylate kinase
MLRVAIEGPCCAGKTTLGHGLTQELIQFSVGYVRDYSDYVGCGKFLPPAVPSSVSEEECSLETFLAIEAARTRHIHDNSAEFCIVLIDRSIYSLLAHCYALEHFTGLGYFEPAASIILRSSIPVWPNVLLYLDVSQDIMLGRNKGKFEVDSIYMNSTFNQSICSYFHQIAFLKDPPILWLDAAQDVVSLRDAAKNWVMEWLQRGEDFI